MPPSDALPGVACTVVNHRLAVLAALLRGSAMLAGLALYVLSLPFHLAAPAFFPVIDRVFCAYEERKILQTFGDEFMGYQSAVWR